MEITIIEALRFKNELSNLVKTLQYKINVSSFGETKEDGETISKNEDSFVDVEESLIKSLSFSEEINNTISSFNKENGVDSIVRKMQNAKLLLSIYNNNLQKTKPSTQKKFENLGTVRKSVTIEFLPSISSSEMKLRISKQKEIIRELQKKVEALNQQTVNVSFNYDEIENLVG